MKFYYIYKALAHPENNGYITPFTLQERLMHVKEARRTLGSKIPWLCDTMDNKLKHALGNAPNSEFLIGPDLKVVAKRLWSDPDQLRRDLERLVGKVSPPTRVSDLNMKTQPPPKVAARGVVQRPELPRDLKALRIEPVTKEGGEPFYAKLRAEADSRLLSSGAGTLYLGFHLDPIYKVHWNNLTKPIKVTLEPPQGMKLARTTLEGPKVKEPADIDPREFLLEVSGAKTRQPLKVSVFYFACNDEAGWCKPIKQEYLVYLQSDPDAGWRMRRRSGGRSGRGGPPFGGRGFGPGNLTRGRIVRVDVRARTVTIMTRDRKQTTYKLADEARLAKEFRSAELKDFQRGDFVMFRIEKSGKGPGTIIGMMGRRGGPGGTPPRRRRQ